MKSQKVPPRRGLTAKARRRDRIALKLKPNVGCAAHPTELHKLGIDASDSTVGGYRPARLRPPSQSWRSFLENHLSDLVVMDGAPSRRAQRTAPPAGASELRIVPQDFANAPCVECWRQCRRAPQLPHAPRAVPEWAIQPFFDGVFATHSPSNSHLWPGWKSQFPPMGQDSFSVPFLPGP